MFAIQHMIAQVSDRRLRERLAVEWANAAKDKKFGLLFEDDLPELLPLRGTKSCKGGLACGRQGALKDVWQVKVLRAGVATRAAAEPVQFPVQEMLVVRELGEPTFCKRPAPPPVRRFLESKMPNNYRRGLLCWP